MISVPVDRRSNVIRAVTHFRIVLTIDVHDSVREPAGIARHTAPRRLCLLVLRFRLCVDGPVCVRVHAVHLFAQVHDIYRPLRCPAVNRRHIPLRGVPLVVHRAQQPIGHRRGYGLGLGRHGQSGRGANRSQTRRRTRRMPAVAAIAVVHDTLGYRDGVHRWEIDFVLRISVTRQIQVPAGHRLVLPRREHVSVTEHLLEFHR